jgi:methyl-accepting chemotaxis protein
VTLAKIVRWVFWSPLVRGPLVVVVFYAGYVLSLRLPIISEQANPQLVAAVLSEVARNNIENVARPEFAYALATEIVRVAAGCALTFLVSYVGIVLALLFVARLRLSRQGSVQDFEANFEKVSKALSDDILVSDAWLAFGKTFVRDKTKDKVKYFATGRPQAFFNASVARDHMFGLRLMPSVPGYFVGLGLLLTFIGLVIALYKAAHGSGASADEMTRSLKDLLNAATFKFATSIAGLFASLVLSLLFRTYGILIERAFERFCRVLESRLRFVNAQTLALQALHSQREQVALLQEMTTAKYMQDLGQAFADKVKPAIEGVMGPLKQDVDKDRKQGLEDLVRQFMEALRGSAGQEMAQIGEVLKETTGALKGMREDLAETGDKFAAKMGEASAAFVAIVTQAGGQLGKSTEGSRTAIEEALKALTQAADDMRRHLEDYATKAGERTGSALDAALKEVLEGLSRHTQSFETSLNAFLQKLTNDAANAAGTARGVIDDTTQAANDAADAVRKSLGEVLTGLRTDIERMSASMSSAEQNFAGIARGVKETVDQSNAAASAFERVAERVEGSTGPLLEASRRIATSTDAVAESVRLASESLATSQATAQALAKELQDNLAGLQLYWDQHASRFENVDVALKGAIETLASETEQYQRRLRDFVVEIDKGFAQSVKSLEAMAGNLADSADEVADNLEKITGRLEKVES